MRRKLWAVSVMISGLCVARATSEQAEVQNKALLVNGHAGEVPVLVVGGRTYVDLQALAQVANGSLTFQGDQVIVTLPSGSPSSTSGASDQTNSSALSRDFMKT